VRVSNEFECECGYECIFRNRETKAKMFIPISLAWFGLVDLVFGFGFGWWLLLFRFTTLAK